MRLRFMGSQGDVLALLGLSVTLPDPRSPWDRQGLITAKQQGCIPQAGGPAPPLKWKMVITHLPTHPVPSA